MKTIIVVLLAFVAVFVGGNVAQAQEVSCYRYVGQPSEDLKTFLSARCESDSKKIDNAIAEAAKLPHTYQVVIAGLAANENLSSEQKGRLKQIRIELTDQKIQDYVKLKFGSVMANAD